MTKNLNSTATLCLLHNLTKTAEDGLTLCSTQTLPCHFPEVGPALVCIFSILVCQMKHILEQKKCI